MTGMPEEREIPLDELIDVDPFWLSQAGLEAFLRAAQGKLVEMRDEIQQFRRVADAARDCLDKHDRPYATAARRILRKELKALPQVTQ